MPVYKRFVQHSVFWRAKSIKFDYLREFWPPNALPRWNLYLPDTQTPLVCSAKDLVATPLLLFTFGL